MQKTAEITQFVGTKIFENKYLNYFCEKKFCQQNFGKEILQNS